MPLREKPGGWIMREMIEAGYQTFVADGDAEFGAGREVSPDGLVVYVENRGEFRVPLDAVKAVHSRRSSSIAASWIPAFGGRSATHTTRRCRGCRLSPESAPELVSA